MLGSGSAGNSALVATDHCKILVDGGLPPQSVTRTFAVTPLATQRFPGRIAPAEGPLKAISSSKDPTDSGRTPH